MRNSSDMTEGVIWKEMLIFVLPIVFGSLFQQLYNTTDAFIVGNFVGKEALAAVGGATGSMINLLLGFFTGLASGVTVLIAQYYGSKDAQALQSALHTGTALGIAGGVFLMAVGIPLAPVLLRAMDTPADILDYAVTYMRVYFIGVIPNLLYNMGSGILRALGDSKRPFWVLVICCAANIVLDLLFVVVFRLEVLGAALATILSQLISCLCVMAFLIKADNPAARLHLRAVRFEGPMLGRMVQIGLPAGFQSSMYGISNVIIQSTINSFGTDAVAAWTIYGRIDAVYWMTISAFGVMITTFVGQNFGAKKFDRIKSGVRQCFLMTAAVSVTITVLTLLLGPAVFRLFNADEAVLAIGRDILHLIPPLFITYIAIEIISGTVRGTGDSVRPMLIILCGVCVLRLIWIYTVVPLHPTLGTAVISYPITWAVTSAIFIIYYLHGGWLRRQMKAAGLENEHVSVL